jgi:hypothetical protein
LTGQLSDDTVPVVQAAADLDPIFDPALLWTTADDAVHHVGVDKPDWTDVQMRPTIGLVAGGAFVYGPGGTNAWDSPYFAYAHYTPMPIPLDLRAVSFANGVSVRCLEAGMSYDLGYQFRDQQDFVADLHFEGLTPPIPLLPGEPPFVGSSHFDQTGRVTGTLLLHGETIAVDCFAVRDRSWGRRPELMGLRHGDRVSYAFGSASASDAFLVFCAPPAKDPLSDVEHLTGGWLLRDGSLRRLREAERRVTRNSVTGFVERLEIDAVDSAGRDLRARGTTQSQLALQTAHVCVNSFMRWEFDGHHGHGEDQDVWSYARLAAKLRSAGLRA